MAASGGYYIASAIKPLYANKNAIVGPIGLLCLIINFGRNWAKKKLEVERGILMGCWKIKKNPISNVG